MRRNGRFLSPGIAVLGGAGLLFCLTTAGFAHGGGGGMGAAMGAGAGMGNAGMHGGMGPGMGNFGMSGSAGMMGNTGMRGPNTQNDGADKGASTSTGMDINAETPNGGQSSDHMSTQGAANTNGPAATDRDTGYAHAQERMSAKGRKHSKAATHAKKHADNDGDGDDMSSTSSTASSSTGSTPQR